MENRVNGNARISRENGNFLGDLTRLILYKCEWSLGSKYHTHLGDTIVFLTLPLTQHPFIHTLGRG